MVETGPISRRRAAASSSSTATAIDHERRDDEEELRKSSDSSQSKGSKREQGIRQVVVLSSGRIRLWCLGCLSTPATASEKRRRRSMIAKAVVFLIYSLLCVGSLDASNGGLPRLALDWIPGLRSRQRRRPRTAMFIVARKIASKRITDRDSRLNKLFVVDLEPNYGGLSIGRLSDGEAREISPDPSDSISDPVLPLGFLHREEDPYDPFDDDGIRSETFRRKNTETRRCKRAPWHTLLNPNCNDFHEVDLLGGVVREDISRLGRGYYRQAFLIKGRTNPDVTLKLLHFAKDVTPTRHEMARMDALVMERLTSSPRITDVYGHCAMSIAVESLGGEIRDAVRPLLVVRSEINDRHNVDNRNGMTPGQKLRLALGISEALAELHGFKDGLIVHNDLDLDQFLKTPDGRVKLNDFNMAKPMFWDSVEKKYCKYYTGHHKGRVRSPEEFTEPPGILNEKIDIYSMGNIFYGILTGLWPFYQYENFIAQRKMVEGERPYIDIRWRERSYAERKLIEAIERCWIHNPDQRTDVFWVVKFLRDAVAENAKFEDSSVQE